MVKVLITGGAGFIPSCMAEKLLALGDYQLVLVDSMLTGNKENIPVHPNCRFIKCDVNNYNDIAAVMTAYKFDYVFHYAAVVGVLRTLQNPVMVLDDIQVELPQHEYTTPLNSRLPYAVVKNIGESYCRSYHQEYGLDYTIFRFFNTYGPKQSPDFVMSKFLNAALRGDDITIYGDGSQSRTFCYIDDNIDACLTTFLDEAYKNDVYNIGNDHVITIRELAETIVELTGSDSKIIYLPPLKEGDMTKRQPDIGRMKELLGRDLLSYKEGIVRTLATWKKPVYEKML